MPSEECATAVPVYFLDFEQLRGTSAVVIETLLSVLLRYPPTRSWKLFPVSVLMCLSVSCMDRANRTSSLRWCQPSSHSWTWVKNHRKWEKNVLFIYPNAGFYSVLRFEEVGREDWPVCQERDRRQPYMNCPLFLSSPRPQNNFHPAAAQTHASRKFLIISINIHLIQITRVGKYSWQV